MFATCTRHQYSLVDLNHEKTGEKTYCVVIELEFEVDEATTPLYKLNYMRICLEVPWRSRVLAHGYNTVIITEVSVTNNTEAKIFIIGRVRPRLLRLFNIKKMLEKIVVISHKFDNSQLTPSVILSTTL